MKFTFPVWRILFLMINFLLITIVVVAQDITLPVEEFFTSGWFLENWEVILLIISEALALLPGKNSGIIKVILFFLKRLIGVRSLNSKSKSK